MNLTAKTLAIALAITISTTGACWAGSIWAKAGSAKQVLHTDDTARKVGDLLTIVIDENSEIENETGRKMNKKSKRDASISSNLDILGAIDALTGKLFNLKDLDVATSAETDFDGSADYDSKRSVKDQITVTIQDVLPNGNLVLLGTVERKVAGDTEIVQISGVVRPSDITFANTVNSDQVADFQITYSSRGRENRFTKPGWLDQVLNFINPF